MNSKQLQYVVMLAQDRSFSHVAERLNISQPALSKQILNLEKELGVKLFDRNSIPLELTPAGAYFVREAKELLYREDQLMRTVEQFRSGHAGQLTIGITPFRSSYLISSVIKKVREHFPGIQIKLHEAGSDILRKEAVDGKFDFAIINLPVDDAALDVLPLEPDRLVLAIPRSLTDKVPVDAQTEQIDFSQCRDLPFVVVGENQEMRILFEKLCTISDFRPSIAAEVVSLTTAWTMACAGIGATILPMQFIRQELFDNNLTVCGIRDAVYTRQPAIVTKRGQYISPAAQYAIDLLTQQTEQ